MVMNIKKRRDRRKKSVRKRITGTPERPRMCIHKTNKNIIVQIIDDFDNKTLCGVTTLSKPMAEKLKGKGSRKNVKAAEMLGEELAKAAQEKGIKKVVFDRAGYRYHGVVKALADSARKGGLEF